MSRDNTSANEKKLPSLTDDQIISGSVNRRSFLTAVGLGSGGLLVAVMGSSCGGSDDCDTDGVDFDPTDSAAVGDPCDNDT